MGFDRSKFSGGSRTATKKMLKETEKKKTGSVSGYHSIVEGKNVFRILPPHNSEHPAYEKYNTSMLICDSPIWEDGEKTNRTEQKLKKIVIASTHSDSLKAALGEKADPIECYIERVKQKAWKLEGKEARQKFLRPINGMRGLDGKWIFGIKPKVSFMCQALDESGEIANLELYASILEKLEMVAISLEDDDVSVDPFSDPNTGYPLVIVKEKVDGKWNYMVSADMPKKGEDWDDFFERTKISDAKLEELFDTKSLHDRYNNSYRMSDFDFAVNGLEIFDKKHGFGIFEEDGFLAELQAINEILSKEINVDTSDKTQEDESGLEEKLDVVETEQSEDEVEQAEIAKQIAALKARQKKK